MSAKEQTPAPDADDAQAARAAIADHLAALEAWLESSPAERQQHWRAVEAAWHLCKQLGAAQEASKQAAALMRAGGKLRSIA